MQIKLRVIEPEKTVLEAEVSEVELLTQEGSLGILQGHVPVAAHLKDGDVSYIKDQKKESVRIKGGFARVLPDSVTVFTY